MIAAVSPRRRGSPRSRGAARSTQTTPVNWRKIALAAVVHLVATTNVVRQPA
jgi:hypothetical protein